MKTSIIIPIYNEEERLPLCLDQLLEYLASQSFDYEVIVSADGCTDGTERVAAEYASRDPHIVLVSFPERLGKGGGILNAARVATGDVLIIMDVDLATPPTQIPLALEWMEDTGADIIYGSRNLPNSRILVQPPIHRKLLGKAFNFLFRLLFGINLHDTQCGFKAIKRDVFDRLSRELNIEGFAFDMDLAVKAVKHGYRIVEMPITWSHMAGSTVRASKQVLEMGRDLLIVWFEGKKREVEEPVEMRKFYDGVSGDVYSRASKSWFLPRRWWHHRKNHAILDSVPDEASIVLDAGFGSGTLFDALLERGKQVVGIDIGEGFIRFAHDEFDGDVNIIQADIEKTPFRGDIFDCIVCSEVLEHIPNAADAIKEMYRVIRPHGPFIITTPNISLRWSFIEAVWTHLRREIIEVGHVAFTQRRLRYYLISSGFRVQENRVFMLGCLNFVTAKKIMFNPYIRK